MRTDDDYLDRMRLTSDKEADDVVGEAFRTNNQSWLYNQLQRTRHALEKQPEDTIRNFLLSKKTLPDWFDHDRLICGQQFFRRYATEVMSLLGALSLPYCYAASPGNKAIYYTGKMRKSPGKRLLETAQFIITTMTEGSFEPEGEGHVAINKTRLIHAVARYYIQSKTNWETTWGVPINQEDMAGTNLAFSYIIVKGLFQTRFPIQTTEAENFLYVWRYIGYQMNIDKHLLPATIKEAEQLETAIRLRHFVPSEEAQLLTIELINHYKDSMPWIAGYLVDRQIRYLVGEPVAALLSLKPHPIKDAFIKAANRLKEKVNQHYLDPHSYEKMLKNHETLILRYA